MQNNHFIHLPKEEQLYLLNKVAGTFDISEAIVEKDLWVCILLDIVFKLPFKMAFKGGTSLSKAFNLIQRHSEDLDFTIDYENFNDNLDLKASRSHLKKVSDQLKNKLNEIIETTVTPHLQAQFENQLKCKVNIQNGNEEGQLEIYYPSVLSDKSSYLREHVLLEFGIRNSTEPSEIKEIKPMLKNIAEASFVIPSVQVPVLSPIRTFWEKATLAHVECHRDRFKESPDRLSRHWYDLYKLLMSSFGEIILERKDILESVIEHKKAFFNSSYANYDDCLSGKFRIVPESNSLVGLASDYKKMQEAQMFMEIPPNFDEIIEQLKKFEEKFNKQKFC